MKLKTQPDPQKAISLMKMAEITLQRLNETPIEKYPSNSLIDYYCVIHKMMEAISLFEGIKFSGEGAHRELIDHISKANKFNLSDSEFIQQMRDYRNRISYEGFSVIKNYITLK